ncbi:pilus assembly FimT family protein [Lyngbya confervoides]|uniref:Prepilin-type N-terminal cleavage/methylation domain-containing protein n=1 Tax=Lyngbya confervoides BDU141951 TaxID=1574623 RepID=A0ABD4T3K4_9CYAN|nr:prepilin-type N-terminal cleavage/methylation domain-containing protein [Lyngbya confervoides]MCM1983074.1 prepilin-type N-terminal cleavage/methylation domain-containing protein [Lyngbya confervoides BDU141951]
MFNRSHYHRRKSFGFTLTETLIILAVMGVMATLAVPSFAALMESIKVDQVVTEIRTTLSLSQRQAIQGGQPCVASLVVQTLEQAQIFPSFQSGIVNACGPTHDRGPLLAGVSVVSNLSPNPSKTQSLANGLPSLESGSVEGLELGDNAEDDWIGETDPNLDLTVWEQSGQWFCENWGWCREQNSSAALVDNAAVVDIAFRPQGTVDYQVQTDQSIPPDPTGKIVAFVSDRPQAKQRCIAISKRLGLTRLGTYEGPLSPTAMTDTGVCTALEWKKQ